MWKTKTKLDNDNNRLKHFKLYGVEAKKKNNFYTRQHEYIENFFF